MIVPSLMPRLFCTAFERAGAIHDGEVLVDARRTSKIRGMLTSFYGVDPGPYEIALATVATDVFSRVNTRVCFLERGDALDRLFADRGVIDARGKHGWVRRSATDPDRFAPARFVVEAAAICPLDTYRCTFRIQDFHETAYCSERLMAVLLVRPACGKARRCPAVKARTQPSPLERPALRSNPYGLLLIHATHALACIKEHVQRASDVREHRHGFYCRNATTNQPQATLEKSFNSGALPQIYASNVTERG